MNVYDFDQTVYDGDSSVDFTFFCLRRQPGLIRYVFRQAFGFCRYTLCLIDKTRFKEDVFSYIAGVADIEGTVRDFWRTHADHLKQWYMSQKQNSDVIISASPEFLLKPICDELNIHIIASRIDPATGKYTGKNCWGEEKVRRFREVYPHARVNAFYSDSYSDAPMARLAEESYMVKGDAIRPWTDKKETTPL